jgi:hypothetical protein
MTSYHHHSPIYKQSNAKTKQAFIGTGLSALIHGAAADDKEPLMREILRGAAKGLGADLGVLLGAAAGGSLGAYGANAVYGPVTENENIKKRVNDVAGYGLAGTGVGGLGGGIAGYLLMNNLINQIGKKPEKTSAVKSAGLSDFLEDVARSYSGSLPYAYGAGGAIAGGLAGAGLGPLVEYFRDKKEKDYRKALLLGLGIGAGTGGTLGAGGGILAKSTINAAIDSIKR